MLARLKAVRYIREPMNTSHPDLCNFRDLPDHVSGVFSTDVVFSTGQTAGIGGCGRDIAEGALQHEIDALSGISEFHTPEQLLRFSVARFSRRLSQYADSDASTAL